MDHTVITTLISIHKDQTAVLNGLWTVYQAVSLALLGYVFSQEYIRKNPWILGFLTGCFLFFSVANQRAISRSQELIVAAASQLKVLAANPGVGDPLRAVLNVYDAVPVSTLEIGHHAFSLLVICAIWVLFAVAKVQAKQQSAVPAAPR